MQHEPAPTPNADRATDRMRQADMLDLLAHLDDVHFVPLEWFLDRRTAAGDAR